MNIFVNPDDHRPRAGWRLFLQFVLFLLLMTVLMLVKSFSIQSSLRIFEATVSGIAGIASVWLAALFWDKRLIQDYGLAWNMKWVKELGMGLILGLSTMAGIFLIEWLTGWITITGFGWERSTSIPYSLWILSYLAAMIIIGFYEELIFRGYQILNMTEGFYSSRLNLKKASLLAILVSSAIFGILHYWNPNASYISTVNIILAGFMLAIPYVVTGSLAVSVGIHISWNFAQGGIFGFPVSGTLFRGSILQIQQEGSNLMTGSRFGPEGGVLGVLGILFIIGFFLFYAKRKYGTVEIHSSFKNVMAKSVKQDE